MELKNKTVLFLGSSVTYGSAAGGVSFADIMAEETGLKMIKEAVSGTTLADVDDASYVARLKRVDKNAKVDLFICQLSTNDAGRGLDLKLTEDAIRFIISYVRDTFSCPIVFYTGTYYNSERYADMVKLLFELQKELNFHIIDLWNDPEMLSIDKETYNYYMNDPVHPKLIGYKEWWTPKFISVCEKI